MTANLSAYLPQDRRRALARGENLPDQSRGALLLADISGFTPFAKTLRLHLGTRRGAEALSRSLDAVYAALIGEVERYGGSVTNFAGDAIFCWFGDEEIRDDGRRTIDDKPSSVVHRPLSIIYAQRAVACAVALQAAMDKLRVMPLPDGATLALSLKAAVAVGNGRRLVVGDEDHYRLDVLAGQIAAYAAAAEQLARPGEVIVDETAVNSLGDGLIVNEWRLDEATGERFAIIQQTANTISPPPELSPNLPDLPVAALRGWLHPGVYARMQSDHAPLLTEFRPCVALFFRFGDIDYNSPAAAAQLDAIVRRIQQVAARYDGLMIDLTIGEKGSYAYLNFGALTIHENDPHRAVRAALSLAESAREVGFLQPPQIGLTQGTLRVGPYGGPTRRHYGALGDKVNLAARLMQAAAPGQILADEAVWRATADRFQAIPQPPLTLKGSAQPVRTYAILGERPTHRARLLQPNYPLPLVGRQAELATIEQKLTLAQAGQSQIVAVTGEAGIGKSRLLAEAIRLAQQYGFVGYEGTCQSDGRDVPYQPWRTVWRGLLGLEEGRPPLVQVDQLTAVLQKRLPHRLNGLPLLGWLLDLPIPENGFTRQLTPQYRQSVLRAILEEFLKKAAQQNPLLIVLEDLHWLDPLSHDLLEALAQATAVYPVCFLLSYRPPEQPRLQVPRLEKRNNFTPLPLTEMSRTEALQLARAKLAQLYPRSDGAIYTALIDDLLARAQGNPFFLEELLNYLRDQKADLHEAYHLELPDSLHTLILSRIDQLSARQKMTVRAASVIGRRFPVKWLNGYYPELGDLDEVQADLDQLDTLDLTLLETAEPETAYLFKHIITQEVAYESLSFAARAELHERLAAYLERVHTETAPLEMLAFHYGRSDNTAKQIEYLRRAGEAAQRNFANAAALDFYDKLLPLLAQSDVEGFEQDKEKFEIYLQRGQVFELLGNYDEAESDYRTALQFAKDDPALAARSQLALGKLMHLRGDYAPALEWLAQAQERRAGLEDKVGLAQVLNETGVVWWHKGEHAQARTTLNKALALAREAGDKLNAAQALNILGLAAWAQGDYATAQAIYKESLSLRREMGDKKAIAASLGNLGLVIADGQGDYATARAMQEESLSLFREIGDKQGVAGSLNNLGNTVRIQGDYATARTLHEESLSLFREMGDKKGVAFALNNLGVVLMAQGDAATAQPLYEESLSLKREMDDKKGVANSLSNLGDATFAQGDNATARTLYEESLALSKEMADKSNEAAALLGLGLVELAENKPEARENILGSLRLRLEMGAQREQTSSLVGAAGLTAAAGDAVGAAQILGAVASALKSLSTQAEPAVRHCHTQTVAAAKQRLGEAAFQQAWDEGTQWSLAEAVAYALG